MKKAVVILLMATVAGFLVFALLWGSGPLVVGERPERQYMPGGPVEVPDSVISASMVFPFEAAVQKVRQGLEGKRFQGEKKKKCWGVGPLKTCLKPNWDLVVESGNPEFAKLDEESFVAKLPMRIFGEVNSGGRALNGMELEARLILLLESRFALRDDDCPDFSARLDYRWVKKPRAKYETKVKTFKIGLTDMVNKAIDKEIAKTEQKLREAFDCERIRAELTRSSAKPVSGSLGQSLFMVYQPKAFGLSGYRLSDDQLEMAIQVRSALAVSPDPQVLGEPKRKVEAERIDADQGRIEIHIPIDLPYVLLEQRLRQSLIENTDGELDKPLGPDMRVERVEVYPSSERLVIGIKVVVATLKGLLEKSAWVYLSVTPELSADGKRLTLSSPELVSVAKSSAVDVLGLRQDVDAVVRKTRQDIDQSIRRALDEQLGQIKGIEVDWQHEAARISDLALLEDRHRFVFHLSGDVRLRLAAEH